MQKLSSLLLVLSLALLASCATATPTAGQGDNSASAAAGNAYAAISGMVVDGTIESGDGADTKIEVTDAEGNTVTIVPGKGVRDIYVHCEIENTADIQQSGSTEATQDAGATGGGNPDTTVPAGALGGG